MSSWQWEPNGLWVKKRTGPGPAYGHMAVGQTYSKMACPGKWKHGRFNLRSNSWWFNIDPYPIDGPALCSHCGKRPLLRYLLKCAIAVTKRRFLTLPRGQGNQLFFHLLVGKERQRYNPQGSKHPLMYFRSQGGKYIMTRHLGLSQSRGTREPANGWLPVGVPLKLKFLWGCFFGRLLVHFQATWYRFLA